MDEQHPFLRVWDSFGRPAVVDNSAMFDRMKRLLTTSGR
jgi:hypothetical protein